MHSASLEYGDCEYVDNTTDSELLDELKNSEVEIVEFKLKLIQIAGSVVWSNWPILMKLVFMRLNMEYTLVFKT